MAQILVLLCFFNLYLYANFNVESLIELKYKDVTKQTFEESCGASSLSTLFNLYGIQLSEKILLEQLKTTNVVNFLDLQKIAYKNSFHAKGYKINKNVFEKIKVPVIARIIRKMGYPHFVVVQNFSKKSVLVLDPNAGKFIVSKEYFYSLWIEKDSNYILLVLPKDKNIKLKKINSFKEKYL
ncbi:C39 family peptidase [Arcobacter sp. CECT 8989]|uniref:C39 family peptidase n=1 Tax=Arcobacteraceae TaxID=2808963 RepID=UPI00100BA739|nr:cysteine peptidase family C39 domain-containing protein [Arcobacter sp. CECT 8989]RXJ98481.1 peptidase C39 [Arcobacter sp. CECT 8989]